MSAAPRQRSSPSSDVFDMRHSALGWRRQGISACAAFFSRVSNPNLNGPWLCFQGCIHSYIFDISSGKLLKGRRFCAPEGKPVTCISFRHWVNRQARDPCLLVSTLREVVSRLSKLSYPPWTRCWGRLLDLNHFVEL